MHLADPLREEVFASVPAATWTLVKQVDGSCPYEDSVRDLNDGRYGVDSRGAAQLLQRLCHEKGLRAWCFEFGDPEVFTHVVTLVEEDDTIWLHDAYLGLSARDPLPSFMKALGGRLPPDLEGSGRLRPYVAAAEYEDAAARTFLGISTDEAKPVRVEVENGLALLENTSPAYRYLIESDDEERLTLFALMKRPVSLLPPPDDSHRDDLSALFNLEPAERSGSGNRRNLFRKPRRGRGDAEQAGFAQDQLGRVIAELLSERRRIDADFATVQSKLAQLTGELTAARQQLKLANAAAEAAGADAKAAQIDRIRFEEAAKAARAEVERLEQRIAQMRAETEDAYAAARAAIETLEHDRDQFTREKQDLNGLLEQAQGELQAARSELSINGDLRNVLRGAAEEKARLLIDNGRLRRDIAESHASVEQQSKQIDALTTALSEVEQRSFAANGDLTNVLRGAAEEKARLLIDNSRLRRDIAESQASLDRVAQELEESRRQTELAEASAVAIEAAERRAEESSEQVAKQQGTIRSLEEALVESELREREHDEQIARAAEEIELLKASVVAIEAAERRAEESSEQVAKQQGTIRSLEEALVESERREREHDQQIARAAEEIELLKASVAAIEAAERRAEESSGQVAKQQGTIRSLEEALVESELREREHDEQIAMAAEQIQLLTAQYEELRSASFFERKRLRRHAPPAAVGRVTTTNSDHRSLLANMVPGDRGRFGPDGHIEGGDAGAGCLCYGPYLDLAPGTYILDVEFERSAFATLRNSAAIIEIVDGPSFLSSKQVELRSGPSHAQLRFEVPPAKRHRQVEFRIMLSRRGRVTLTDLSLSRQD